MVTTKTIARVIKQEVKKQKIKGRKNIGYRRIAASVRQAVVTSLLKQRKNGNVIQLKRVV